MKPSEHDKGFWRRLKKLFSGDDSALAEELPNGVASAVGLARDKREMIERVIAFDEKRVRDVMAPRADIIAVDLATPMDELVKAFADAGHSRLPVYRHDLDDPVGMVHIKDVVAQLAQNNSDDKGVLEQLRRDVLYAPPSMRVTDLLLRMQASRIHMALVIDEFGGTDGLLTIEDLVEQIVGDINDEHDDEEAPMIIAASGGGWEADARVEVQDFVEATGVALEGFSEEEEVDTLGGWVFSVAGRVPQRGEVIHSEQGLTFEVMDADPRTIRKVRICPDKDRVEQVKSAPPGEPLSAPARSEGTKPAAAATSMASSQAVNKTSNEVSGAALHSEAAE